MSKLRYEGSQEIWWDGTDGYGHKLGIPQKVTLKDTDYNDWKIILSNGSYWHANDRALSPLDNTSLRTAVEGSIKHHMEGVMCTSEEAKNFELSEDACSLCQLYNMKCDDCFLKDPPDDKCGHTDSRCCTEWRIANAKQYDNFQQFHDAEVALVKRLQAKLDELTGSKYENVMYKPCAKHTHGSQYIDKKRGYQVGDEIVMHDGKGEGDYEKWLGMKLKVVRESITHEKYEMCIDNGKLDDSGFPGGDTFSELEPSLIIRCTDPRYWTKEVDGVLYRAYEQKGGSIRLYWNNKKDANWFNARYDDIPIQVMDLFINTHNIPIMPYGYMGEDYDFEYPVRETK